MSHVEYNICKIKAKVHNLAYVKDQLWLVFTEILRTAETAGRHQTLYTVRAAFHFV